MGDVFMNTKKLKGWGIIHDYGDSFDTEKGPLDKNNFWLDLRIDVEIESGAVISYQLFVCSPAGLSSHFEEFVQQISVLLSEHKDYVFGRGLLILLEYNLDIIEQAINSELQNMGYYAFDLS